MIFLQIHIPTQKLFLYKNDSLVHSYPISSSKKGIGQENGSKQTPQGWHIVRAKIGNHCKLNTVFKGRRPTGEIFNEELKRLYPDRDWILTRILWLSGLEKNKNRLGTVDTMQRFIYIHGTAEENLIGQPASQGCIRMKNTDLLDLFNQVEVGIKICII